MRLSKEPTQKDWILKINLKSGSGSVSCRPPRVRHTDIYRSRFYPISVVLLTLTLAVLTCSELRLRVSTLELRELRSVSGNKWWQAHYIVMAVCLLAPSSLRLLFTFNWGVSIRISASKHSLQSSQMYAKSFRQRMWDIFWRRILFISSLLCLFLLGIFPNISIFTPKTDKY